MWLINRIQHRLAAVLLGWGLALAVSAHGARNDVRVEIVPLQQPGLTVELHQDALAPQLVVANRTGKPLEIIDDEGRVFLRIGPAGAEGDLAARAFHLSRVSGGGNAHANTLSKTPRWKPLARTPEYGWFDARLSTATLQIPYAVQQIGDEMPFQSWRIPARLGGEAIELRGVFTYTPPPKGVAMATLLNAAALPPGVNVQLSMGPIPALFLRNSSAQTVSVLDAEGKPYLKIGREGVWADTGSAAWRAASTLPLPPGRKGWQQLSKASSYTWLEPRAAWRGPLPSPLPASGLLNEWRVPLLIGEDQKAELLGSTRWIARKTS
ncbi:MAG: hypothetical protein V4709_06905 [Pseudomonadota bacterium]